MKKILFLIILPALLLQLSSSVLFIAPAQADNPLDVENQEGFDSAIPDAFGQNSKPTDIRTIVVNVIVVVLSLLGIIFVILLIYAGFKWMTAAGNSDQVEDAKKLITNSAIGLLVILSSYAVTLFITKWVIKAVNNDV